MYSYIGELYIELIGGEWKLNTIKRDPAYGRLCVVNWSKGATRIDPMQLLRELKETQDYDLLYNSIELTKNNIINVNNILKDLNLDF